MATIDVRKEDDSTIDKIVFADEGVYAIERGLRRIVLLDVAEDCMFVENKEHAQNLIKALNKAIELGWLR